MQTFSGNSFSSRPRNIRSNLGRPSLSKVAPIDQMHEKKNTPCNEQDYYFRFKVLLWKYNEQRSEANHLKLSSDVKIGELLNIFLVVIVIHETVKEVHTRLYQISARRYIHLLKINDTCYQIADIWHNVNAIKIWIKKCVFENHKKYISTKNQLNN